MPKVKATHRGSCQGCDSVQKLPKGMLAKHGYNIHYGFFSGICGGSGHLPFEQSCDLIKGFIKGAENALADYQADRTELLKPATSLKVWYYKYDPSYYRLGSDDGHKWIEIELVDLRKEGSAYMIPGYIDSNGTATTLPIYGYANKTMLDVATEMQKRRADFISKQIAKVEKYIFWQTNRIKNWKPAKLHPITTLNS